MDDYFIYDMLHQHQSISGIILNLNHPDFLTEKITHHEKVCANKVNRFYQQLSVHSQKTPIILGVTSVEFETLLAASKSHERLLETHPEEHLWSINNKNKRLITRALKQLPEILLIDGHHRFHALQALKKNIYAWIVPFYKLSISSFVKVFHCQKSTFFYEKLLPHFSILPTHSLVIDSSYSQINFYFKNQFYQIRIEPPSSFLNALDVFYTLMMQEKLELIDYQKYQSDALTHLTHQYTTDHLIITHSNLKHGDLIDSSILLPMHSTYFEPKPTMTSLNSVSKKNDSAPDNRSTRGVS